MNENRIEVGRKLLWPNTKKLSHWSGLRISERAELLKSPFQEIYEVKYPMLSWYVHSGLTGVVNLNAETFTVLCGIAFQLAAETYRELLLTMIREFKIAKADGKIEGKLEAAKYLAFADGPEQAQKMYRHLTR